MNLSSRWCVTAVIALGALSCSDPVPPPAQGAFRVRLTSLGVSGKSCPSGAAQAFAVPEVPASAPAEELSENVYAHKIIDGESSSSVSCNVKGDGTFTFDAHISFGAKSLDIMSGTLGADKKGTARISVSNSQILSTSLSSPSPANCVITATGASLQAQPGSMWATFSCPSVDHAPSDSCGADGVFVLENCGK